MKKLIIFILMLASIAVAGDIFNNGRIVNGNSKTAPSSGDYLIYFEDYSHITYKWVFTYIDSSDDYHSRPLYIGNVNVSDGYVTAIQSTTGDANIIYHFSADDRNTWEVTTPADLDAVSGTSKPDTIGINSGADDILFHAGRWLVIEAASGSSTNADDNVLTFVLKLKKETPTTTLGNGDYVRLARVANASNTNP